MAMGKTKVVPILQQMFESIKKPYKEPSPTVHKINIIDFDNFAHGLPWKGTYYLIRKHTQIKLKYFKKSMAYVSPNQNGKLPKNC